MTRASRPASSSDTRPAGRVQRGDARRAARRTRLLASAVALLIVTIAGLAWLASGPVARGIRLTGLAGHATATTPAAAARLGARRAVPATVTVAAVGDLMFGQGVSRFIDAAGPTAILSRVATQLAAADLALGNLEGPLASGGRAARGKDVTLLGNPKAIRALSSAGIDAVSLANNHALDYGVPGLRSTIAALDRARIQHAGAGLSEAAARRPAVLAVRGVRVAFLSYSHIRPAGFVATAGRPGIAASRWRMADVAKEIRSAKRSNDLVIVAFHWGVERRGDADSGQIADGHAAVDAGADLVIGSHPHVIQGIERYKGKLIAYSLGDFVFDHAARKTGESFILSIELGPGGTGRVRVVPTYAENSTGRPAVVRGAAARAILKRLALLSAKLGTDIVLRSDEATVEMK